MDAQSTSQCSKKWFKMCVDIVTDEGIARDCLERRFMMTRMYLLGFSATGNGPKISVAMIWKGLVPGRSKCLCIWQYGGLYRSERWRSLTRVDVSAIGT